MSFDSHQAMKKMIEAAAKDQEKQINWIGEQYKRRQEWLKNQHKVKDSKDELA